MLSIRVLSVSIGKKCNRCNMKPVVVQGLCNNKNFATYFFDKITVVGFSCFNFFFDMITVLGFSCLDTMCQDDSEFLLFAYLGFFYFP